MSQAEKTIKITRLTNDIKRLERVNQLATPQARNQNERDIRYKKFIITQLLNIK